MLAIIPYIIAFLPFDINRSIILRVMFYGCETWSLTLRDERKLRVADNGVLR